VFCGYCKSKFEWKRHLDHEINFKGKICYIFPQVILLMQTNIAYYIPLSGVPPRYPRVEAFLRHTISLGFVLWWWRITSKAHKLRKLLIFSSILPVHYITAALFERHKKSFKRFLESQATNKMDDTWSSQSRRKIASSTSIDLAGSANNTTISPVIKECTW